MWMKKSLDPAHDFGHSESVTKTALEICRKIGYKDMKVIRVICWWHDVGRLFSPIHEELSAQIAKYNLEGLRVDDQTIGKVYQGIRFHKWSMRPETIEGNILRDADKLDFISIERWRKCLEKDELEHLGPIVNLLSQLREILYFEESKNIYNKKMKIFTKGVFTLEPKSQKAENILRRVKTLLNF